MADHELPHDDSSSAAPHPLPRVTIKFCTQCKWMLRAAYYAQELLSTFSTSLGEVALQPATGGTFVVAILHAAPVAAPPPDGDDHDHDDDQTSAPGPAPMTLTNRVLWDRRADGGFPETKELKRRVRDVIEPGRDLGHVDRHPTKPPAAAGAEGGSGGGEAAAATKRADDDDGTGGAGAGAGADAGAGEVTTSDEKLPSRTELEAAGQAGGGYPGSGEAAAQLVGDLKAREGGGGGGGKEVCEDCS